MQSDWKEIYRLTAERTGGDEQLYKDVGNMIFSTLYKKIRRPTSILLKLKGVGTWYLRKKRLEIFLSHFPPNWEKTEEDFSHPMQFIKNENKKEIYLLFQERLKEYEEYVALKNEIRIKRNERAQLLRPTKREDDSE